MRNSLVLVYAMRPEASLIHQRLGPFEESFFEQGVTAWTRRIGTRDLVLLETGIGCSRVRAALQQLSQLIRIESLLSFGYAGALDPHLEAGDLVIASRVLALQGQQAGEEYEPDPAMTQRALDAAGGLARPTGRGSIATVDQFIADVDRKRELYLRTGAQAVEMESSEVARFARQEGLPAAFVRAISDEAEFDLTDWAGSLAESGATNQWAFKQSAAGAAGVDLKAVTEAFRRKSILASDRLARFAVRLCASR